MYIESLRCSSSSFRIRLACRCFVVSEWTRTMFQLDRSVYADTGNSNCTSYKAPSFSLLCILTISFSFLLVFKQSMVSKTSLAFSVTFFGRSVCGLEECKWISSGFFSREKRRYRMWCVCLCNRMLRILTSTNQLLTSNTSSFCFLSPNSATELCLPTFSFDRLRFLQGNEKNLDVLLRFDAHIFFSSVHECLYSFTRVLIDVYIYT